MTEPRSRSQERRFAAQGAIDIRTLVVYLTLVTSHDGEWTDKHPSYLDEKCLILGLGKADWWGFAHLDLKNMKRAIAYLDSWKLPVPQEWLQEIERQDEAWARLGRLGIDIEQGG